MALRTSDDVVNAACDAAVGLVDAGGAGKIQFYSGDRPAGLGDVPAGVLLAELDFQAPAFDGAVGGNADALGVPLESIGLDDGELGFARVVNGSGVVLWDEDDIGTAAGNAITVNTRTVSTGVNFEVTSYTFFAAA